MNVPISLTLVCISALTGPTLGANILAIFHMPSQSHQILGSALLKTLAQRGHQVTMVSPFPLKHQVQNYRDIFIEELLQYKQDSMQNIMKHNVSITDKLGAMQAFQQTCDIVLSHPKIEKLKNEKFDLVIIFALFTESLLGLAHHFNAASILFSTLSPPPFVNNVVGNPNPVSYVPNMALSFPSDMNFLQRVANTIAYLLGAATEPYFRNQQEALLRKYFPDAPPMQDLIYNVSLIFVNSHYSIENPRPYVPNMIQIGGFHVEEPKQLPEDIRLFLDGATNGAVFFSLGSNVKFSNLTDETRNSIITTLGRLNMRVLLKSEVNFTNLPDNIKVGKWLPQNDILGHPNVKLFISHGGLLSTTEAVYHAVPIIGIPFFGDQMYNIADAVNSGFALKLDIGDLTKQTLSEAIEEILTNPKYRKSIELKSQLLREQPIKPMDLAIFWVEHVLKHKGAQHLKNAGVKLKWYQYFLLDVVAFLLAVIGAAVLALYLLVKTLWGKCRRYPEKSKVKTN